MIKYSIQDLVNIKEAYRKNFKQLLKHVGTNRHRYFLRKEEQLHKKEVKIQKALGVYIHDPCPARGIIPCAECTGYYYKRFRWTSEGYHVNIAGLMCNRNHPKAIKCVYKRKEVTECKNLILPRLNRISRRFSSSGWKVSARRTL